MFKLVALFKYFSERTVSLTDTCAGNVHDDVICCEVHVLNLTNRLGRNGQKTTNTSDCMLLLVVVLYLSFQQLMCVYMYMHCILFIHPSNSSCACTCTCTVYYSYIFYMFRVIFLLLYKRTTSHCSHHTGGYHTL